MAVIKSNEYIFNKIYKAIALFAVSCVITPITYLLFFNMLGLNVFIAFIIPLLLLMLGYFIQAGFAKIRKIKRKPQDLSYESNTKYFSMKDATLPITLCFVISIVAFNIVIAYLKYRVEVGIDLSYDRDSLYPYIMLFISSAIMIIGVVMWFYPYSRIISMRSMFVYFCLFVIIFLYTFVMPFISTLCMILFMLCSLIILNQSNIIKTIGRTKFGVVTTRVRLYNAGTIVLFIAAALGILVVVAAMLVGVTVIVQFLFPILLAVMFNDDSVPNDFIPESSGGATFDVSLFGFASNSFGIHALWYLFILIVISTLICLIFIRQIKNVFKSIGDFFGRLINNIVDLFMDIFFFFSLDPRSDTFEFTNYKDEELDIDKTSAKIKMQEFSKKRYSYKDYTNKFNSFKTLNEKYIFAYQTLVGFWGDMDFSLKKSDTPRQIENKLLARTTIDQVPDITRIFENYHYGEMRDSGNNSDTLAKVIAMNKLIEKYYA